MEAFGRARLSVSRIEFCKYLTRQSFGQITLTNNFAGLHAIAKVSYCTGHHMEGTVEVPMHLHMLHAAVRLGQIILSNVKRRRCLKNEIGMLNTSACAPSGPCKVYTSGRVSLINLPNKLLPVSSMLCLKLHQQQRPGDHQ